MKILSAIVFVSFLSLSLCQASDYTVTTPNNYLNSDTSSVINAALKLAAQDASGSGRVLIPAGQYRIDAPIKLPDSSSGGVTANVVIEGEGIGVTQIVGNTSGDVLQLIEPNASYSVSIKKLSILSMASGGTALDYSCASGSPSNSLSMQYVAVAAYNVQGTSSNTTNIFSKGLVLSNASNTNISNCMFASGEGMQVGTGIEIATESDNIYVSDTQINNCETGMLWDADETNVWLRRNYWVENIKALYSNHNASWIGLEAVHIDLKNGSAYSGDAAVYIANASYCYFDHVLFFRELYGDGIHLGTANNVSIAENVFFDNTGVSGGYNGTPIILGTSGSSSANEIIDNVFQYNQWGTLAGAQVPWTQSGTIGTEYLVYCLINGVT